MNVILREQWQTIFTDERRIHEIQFVIVLQNRELQYTLVQIYVSTNRLKGKALCYVNKLIDKRIFTISTEFDLLFITFFSSGWTHVRVRIYLKK